MPPTSGPIAIAALFGACGTALIAAGSHAAAGGLATTAGQMLLWHAPSIIAAALARESGFLHRAIGTLAIVLLIAGVGLFAADLAVRAFLGWPRLFPMAAPTGGGLTIAGWVILVVAALARRTTDDRDDTR